jgi:hypothetical protein
MIEGALKCVVYAAPVTLLTLLDGLASHRK